MDYLQLLLKLLCVTLIIHLATSTPIPSTPYPLQTMNTNSAIDYTQCPADVNKCENKGTCYYAKGDSKKTFCRCTKNFHGDKCELKSLVLYKQMLYGAFLFAALFFIVAVISSCRLYITTGELKEVKREKYESETFYQKANNPRNKPPLSRVCSEASIISEEDTFLHRNSPKGDIRKVVFVENEITRSKRITSQNSIEKRKVSQNSIDKTIVSRTVSLADLEEEAEEKGRHSCHDDTASTVSTQSEGSSNCDPLNASTSRLLIPLNNRNSRPNSWSDGDRPSPVVKLRINSGDFDSGFDISNTNIPMSVEQSHVDGKGYYNEHEQMKTPQRKLTPVTLRKHKARSLQDLRVLAMTHSAPTKSKRAHNGASEKPIVNMHTGQIARPVSIDDINVHKHHYNKNYHHHGKPKGIWSR